jgi:AcrR family transcriptional regulator
MSPRLQRVPRVTIGDIAAAADVSRSTVSRAFTRPQLLSPATGLTSGIVSGAVVEGMWAWRR